MGDRVLLVLGNSVSMSPPEAVNPVVVPYPDLLRDLLASDSYRVEDKSASGLTVQDIAGVAFEAVPRLRPTVVVIQLGIVDCAPRPLRPRERDLLGRVRPAFLRDLIVGLVHRQRGSIIARRSLIQRTDIVAFRKSFRELVDRCTAATKTVVILPIFPATSSILARNPRLAAEIDKYNQVMRDEGSSAVTFSMSDIFGHTSIEALSVTPESVHLNQLGHERIAHRLATWLRTSSAVSAE